MHIHVAFVKDTLGGHSSYFRARPQFYPLFVLAYLGIYCHISLHLTFTRT